MKKHIGSTIAFILGILLFTGSFPNAPGIPNYSAGALAGPVIILGALAYRSAKKRYLGEVKSSLLRKCLEVSALVIIVAAVLLQNNLKYQIATDPVPNFFIPLWAIIAYIIIALKKPKLLQEVEGVNKHD